MCVCIRVYNLEVQITEQFFFLLTNKFLKSVMRKVERIWDLGKSQWNNCSQLWKILRKVGSQTSFFQDVRV